MPIPQHQRAKVPIFACILLHLVFSASQLVAQKASDAEWQTGTLTSADIWGWNLHGPAERQWRFVIDDDRYTYEASAWIHGTNGLNVTERGPISFKFGGSGFYIKDDDGKIHKLIFEKKTLH